MLSKLILQADAWFSDNLPSFTWNKPLMIIYNHNKGLIDSQWVYVYNQMPMGGYIEKCQVDLRTLVSAL